MDVTDKWWSANHISSGRNYEDLEEIKGTLLTHVASVKVLPPWGRHDLQCHIYGEISFNVVGDTRDFVTLYNRDRDNAEFMDLADAGHGSYLTLSDRHESERPLLKVKSSKPLLFKMKLYETIGGLERKYTLIANIDGQDSGCMTNHSNYLQVEGELGFRFELGYSVVFGARIEVGVKVKKIEEGDPDRRISMWGHIEAYQYLENLDHSPCGETFTLLRVIDKTEPVTFNVGDQIELERRYVVAPMVYDKYLCVRIAPLIDKDDYVVYHVNFPLMPEPCLTSLAHASFWTNKEMTRTKDICHNGTVFSVSITLIPPEENEHVPKIPASTKWRKLSSPKELGCDDGGEGLS